MPESTPPYGPLWDPVGPFGRRFCCPPAPGPRLPPCPPVRRASGDSPPGSTLAATVSSVSSVSFVTIAPTRGHLWPYGGPPMAPARLIGPATPSRCLACAVRRRPRVAVRALPYGGAGRDDAAPHRRGASD